MSAFTSSVLVDLVWKMSVVELESGPSDFLARSGDWQILNGSIYYF